MTCMRKIEYHDPLPGINFPTFEINTSCPGHYEIQKRMQGKLVERSIFIVRVYGPVVVPGGMPMAAILAIYIDALQHHGAHEPEDIHILRHLNDAQNWIGRRTQRRRGA